MRLFDISVWEMRNTDKGKKGVRILPFIFYYNNDLATFISISLIKSLHFKISLPCSVVAVFEAHKIHYDTIQYNTVTVSQLC